MVTMSLQQLIVQIQDMSSSTIDLDRLNEMLKGPGVDLLLKQQSSSILDHIQALDYEAHSLGCAYLL